MHRIIVATILAIGASTNMLAHAAQDRRAAIRATIERGGTKAEWSKRDNMLGCRLVSFIPIKYAGPKAAVVIDTLNDGRGIPLKRFSFKIHYTPQLSKHVRPDVVVQVEDDNGARHEERYTYREMSIKSASGDREQWTKSFDQPKRIRHIFVGGEQLDYRKEHMNFMGALDFTFCDFYGIFGDNGKPMNADINMDVRVVKPGEDPLLKLLTGTIDSENPK